VFTGLTVVCRLRQGLAAAAAAGTHAKAADMLDLNNRPGGPNLIVTAKTAHKVHFLDAATLTTAATIDMPGSTHELALSLDGRTAYGTVYGDGIFAKRINPDRRIVVIDLRSRSLARVIDLGGVLAPHGVMMDESGMLWSSGELGNCVLVIDPATERVERIDVGATAHWVAISHEMAKVFVSCKQDNVAVLDIARRAVIDRIAVPHVIEGLAISPDGATLYCCAQSAAEFYVIDARNHALMRTVPIAGADASKRQMRRRIIMRRSTGPTALRRSHRFQPRNRRWVSALPPTAGTPICAATTTPKCSNSSSRPAR
jgi:DNA-binding beta-propeller fold protein YncE